MVEVVAKKITGIAEAHWGKNELEELAEPLLQCNESRPDWVEPQFAETITQKG
jgi:hypothetical protein